MTNDDIAKNRAADDRAMAFAYAYFGGGFNFKKAYLEVFNHDPNIVYSGYKQYVNSPRVQAALETVRKEFNNQSMVTIHDVEEELHAIAFSDIHDVVKSVDKDGMIELNDLDTVDTRFIQSIESGTVGDKFRTGAKLKTHDKSKALEHLIKLKGPKDSDGGSFAAAIAEAYDKRVEEKAKLNVQPDNDEQRSAIEVEKDNKPTVDEGLPPQ